MNGQKMMQNDAGEPAQELSVCTTKFNENKQTF